MRSCCLVSVPEVEEVSDNKPYFISEKQSVSVEPGEKAVIKVQVGGRPSPTLRWQVTLTSLFLFSIMTSEVADVSL